MIALFSAARGKLVSSQASEKFAQRASVGDAKPVPPSWSGAFSAVTTVRYSGISTVSDSTTMRAVSHQFTFRRGPTGRRRKRPGGWRVVWPGRGWAVAAMASELDLPASQDPQLHERDRDDDDEVDDGVGGLVGELAALEAAAVDHQRDRLGRGARPPAG